MNEIHYNLENGNHVFRKKRESVEEALFYNKEYFARIGFPDAEIRIESATTGGSYNPNKVTVPFRQFVYLVQGSNNKKNGFSFFGKNKRIKRNRIIIIIGLLNDLVYTMQLII